jgi:CHAT domain-containing protein/tetratricopeptide (TPR) repeat protein
MTPFTRSRRLSLRNLVPVLCVGTLFLFSACAGKPLAVPPEPARQTEIALGTPPTTATEEPTTDVVAAPSTGAARPGLAPPPPGLSEKALAQFHYDQAVDLRRSGHPLNYLAAHRLAHEHAKRAYSDGIIYSNDGGVLRDYLYERIWAEYQVGDSDLALSMTEWITRHADRPTTFAAYSMLARFHAWAGNLDKARAALSKSEEIWRIDTAPHTYKWGPFNRQAAIGAVRHAEGDAKAALESYREMVATGPDAEIIVGVREAVVNALRDLGRHKEAEAEARGMLADATRLSGEASMSSLYAHVSLVRVLGDQGRTDEALAIADRALALGAASSAASGAQILDGIVLEKARLLADRRDYQASIDTFNPLLNSAETVSWVASSARWSLVRAEALWQAGRAMDARRIVAAIRDYRMMSFGPDTILTAECTGMLAAIDAELGARDLALALFQEAIPVILAHLEGRTGSSETSVNRERMRRLELVAEAYLDLLAGESAGTAITEANIIADSFRLADIGRTPIVEAAIRQHTQRLEATAAVTADLIRQQQDLGIRIDSLLSQIVALPVDLAPAAAASLRDQIARYRSEREATLARLQRQDPGFAELLQPKPADLATVRGLLLEGEALLAIHVGLRASYVWAVPKRGTAAFARIAIGRDEATRLVGRLLAAVHPKVRTLADFPDLDIAAARDIYRHFVAPVAASLESADILVAATSRPFGKLPLAMLLTEDFTLDRAAAPLFAGYQSAPWLARRFAMVQLPAVRSLVALRGAQPGKMQTGSKPLAAFGAPLFAGPETGPGDPSGPNQLGARGRISLRATLGADLRAADLIADLPPLPDTAQEVSEIAAELGAEPSTSVFIGAAANEAQVKSMNLADRRVLVFATHGLLPHDLPGLTQPALALASPEASGTEGDGLLTMGEILALKLNADWVLLSACNTAAGEDAGADALTGLGRAFFYAGARAILASNWPVETVSARLLTTGVFQRQRADRTLSKASALQQSMLALMDNPGARLPDGSILFSYAHPIFWAPFSLVGDGV